MTKREFLKYVDRCKLTDAERRHRDLPTAVEDIRAVLDEAYFYLSQSKEWTNAKKKHA